MDPLQEFAPTVITLVMDILAVVMVATLVRTFIGPRKSDRMVGVNMLGTSSAWWCGFMRTGWWTLPLSMPCSASWQ